jgi:hypothetical protein
VRTPVKRLIGLAALLPLLVFAASALRYNQFRCLLSGVVTADPCCPAAAGDDQPVAPASLAVADCCSHEAVVAARPPSELPSGAARPPVAPVVAVALPVVLDPAAASVSAAARPASPPPRPKSPLVLLKRSLLI